MADRKLGSLLRDQVVSFSSGQPDSLLILADQQNHKITVKVIVRQDADGTISIGAYKCGKSSVDATRIHTFAIKDGELAEAGEVNAFTLLDPV